jgi:hypothetical protein
VRLAAAHRRYPRHWLVILSITLALWFLSLCLHVTHYGDKIAVTAQAGFIGVYWGNRCGARNSWVYNHWVAPWCGRGSGRGWNGSPAWELEGPSSIWNPQYVDALMTSGSLLQLQFGFVWPRIVLNSTRHDCEPETAVVPMWAVVAAASVPFLVALRQNVRRRLAGFCPRCSYNLTGNVSGRCPECGTLTARSTG